MRREYVLTSIVSAAIGAGLMLFAVGGSNPAGIEGWTPINTEVASAMQKHEDMSEAAKESKGAASASAVKSQGSTGKAEANQPSGSAGSAESSQPPKQNLININQAGLTELQEIPGIGKKKAEAIIDYRNAHGAFTSVNDLKKVKGIGDKMLEKMKPYIGL
ncbi:helix-hairpin-helix domain-containing protein [Paenibacillus puldeungensis]|uniref:Helix-hairpin-helix domain-containing protein n=1 Tax=Paenibacillus puldeungensis TaxID=696536 RepID=A0ABW3RYV2_9BACL